MKTITVSKPQLLSTLKANREKHETEYKDAVKGYLETGLEKLQALILKLEKGEVVNANTGLTPPECQLNEYDRAINMLSWHVDDTIEMTMEEFSNYVQDDWAWKRHWSMSNAAYLSKVRD